MRKTLMSFLALFLLLPAMSLAADLRTAEVVSKEENPKNLYLGGENPTVDANVSGDLVVAGGKVTVNGNVEDGVISAGGDVILNGNIGRSVRVAGGTVVVEGVIGGDLIVFSGDVTLGTKSVVMGDVVVFAGTAALKGEVAGSVKSSFAGDVLLAGKTTGNVELMQVGNLKVDATATIGGDLNYSSQYQADISSQATVGGKVNYSKVTTSDRDYGSGGRLGSLLMSALMAFVTLFVLIFLAPKALSATINNAVVNPLSKVGMGFLALVVGPIAIVLIAISVLGLGVMGYLFMAYVAFFVLASSLTALLLGGLAWKLAKKEDQLTVSWKTALIGVLLVALGKFIPVLGWVALFIAFLAVFGSLVSQGFAYIKEQRA